MGRFHVWFVLREAGGLWSVQQGDAQDGGLVMSDVISIFPTIFEACAKTRHYCCDAPSRELPADNTLSGKRRAPTGRRRRRRRRFSGTTAGSIWLLCLRSGPSAAVCAIAFDADAQLSLRLFFVEAFF